MHMNNPAELVIEHDIPGGRFYTDVDGYEAELDYIREENRMVITHTGVPSEIGGRGVAAAMTVAALNYARANALRVVPACEYAAAFVRRHGEYADLVE